MGSLVNISHVSTAPDNKEIKKLDPDQAKFLRKKLELEENADLSGWETNDGKVFMKANTDKDGKTSFQFLEILSKLDKNSPQKYEGDNLETILFTLMPSVNNLDAELLKKAAYTAGKQFRSINKQIGTDGDIKTRIAKLKEKPISIKVSIDKDTINGIYSSGSEQLARMKVVWENKAKAKAIEEANSDEFKKHKLESKTDPLFNDFYWQIRHTDLYKKPIEPTTEPKIARNDLPIVENDNSNQPVREISPPPKKDTLQKDL